MSKLKLKLQKIAQWFLASPIRLMVVPYFVGIVWHSFHPTASILTGDFKRPRRWYIDENSLDPNQVTGVHQYQLILQTKYDRAQLLRENRIKEEEFTEVIDSLCKGLEVTRGESRLIPCHRHHSGTTDGSVSFEISMIVPQSAGIAPVSEALVIVLPPFVPFSFAHKVHKPSNAKKQRQRNPKTDKSRPQFQASILELVRRLASPQSSPWLAKTVYFVSPILSLNQTAIPAATKMSLSPLLEETVESFLDAYLGPLDEQKRSQMTARRLPTEFTGAILRNLIVLDLEVFESKRSNQALPTNSAEADAFQPEIGEVRIMPQGRRGVLPNMDLTFLFRTVYERSTMTTPQRISSHSRNKFKFVKLFAHPYRERAETVLAWLKEHGLPDDLHKWANDMIHLLCFESTMAVGPFPPHAPALQRGIDSLTVQGSFVSATDDDDVELALNSRIVVMQSVQGHPLELVEKMEWAIRGLSNLHERLHHSTTLYLLPSLDAFVKHEEYLVPNLLLVIPLLIRGILMVFGKAEAGMAFWPNFAAAGQAVLIVAFWTMIMAAAVVLLPSYDGGDATIMQKFGNPYKHFSLLTAIYMCCFLGVILVHSRTNLHLSAWNARRSVQFLACLWAACIHAALAFGHVCLSYPSALFWTPLLAFPNLQQPRTWSWAIIRLMLFFCFNPFLILVPHIFPSYTPYVLFAYVPLHMLFSLLHIVPIFVT